ncbi:hypothetical protein AURDEDRAFT_28012, partial [Auricularia subglabra TFB-10046 SS5]
EVRGQMPIWYHPHRSRDGNDRHTSEVIKCLRRVHGVLTVRDAVTCGHNDQLNAHQKPHRHRINCGCRRCRADRSQGCPHPFKCQEYAATLTNAIGAKWSPHAAPPDLGGVLSEEETVENEQAFITHEPVTFDPAMQAPREVHETFRVF